MFQHEIESNDVCCISQVKPQVMPLIFRFTNGKLDAIIVGIGPHLDFFAVRFHDRLGLALIKCSPDSHALFC